MKEHSAKGRDRRLQNAIAMAEKINKKELSFASRIVINAEELKKFEIRSKGQRRRAPFEDISDEGERRAGRDFSGAGNDSLSGSEQADEKHSSDKESESSINSMSMALRKRRPIRGMKSSFNASNAKSSQSRAISNSAAWKQLKASHFRVKEIEDRLRSLLSRICELPINVEKHLEWVYEELKDIERMMDQIQGDLRSLFSSSIGKFLFTLRHIIKETYLFESRSLDIDQLLVSLIKQSASIIGRAVSNYKLVF